MKTTNSLIANWVKLGVANHWIARATDPFFDENSFRECTTVDELAEFLSRGNWCVGTAFFYKDICFINQVNGGGEWLTIKGKVPFESISIPSYNETEEETIARVHEYIGIFEQRTEMELACKYINWMTGEDTRDVGVTF